MRISDWSSDVCSSDLRPDARAGEQAQRVLAHRLEVEDGARLARTVGGDRTDALGEEVKPLPHQHEARAGQQPVQNEGEVLAMAQVGRIAQSACMEESAAEDRL